MTSLGYDKLNSKALQPAGWKRLYAELDIQRERFGVPADYFHKCFLDIGCGRGHVLQYAQDEDSKFMETVGVEVNEDTKFLKGLVQNKHIFIGDVSSDNVMEALLEKSTCIYWSGMLFDPKDAETVVKLVEDYGRVGSFLVTNSGISSNQLCELSTITMDDCFEQTTDWGHKTTWKFYALKPKPKKQKRILRKRQRAIPKKKEEAKKNNTSTRTRNTVPSFDQNSGVTLKDQIKELSWIFTAFRYYYESKAGGKIITIAEIKDCLPMIDSAYKMLQDYLEVLPDYAPSVVQQGGIGFSGKNTKKRRGADDFLISYDIPSKRRRVSNTDKKNLY